MKNALILAIFTLIFAGCTTFGTFGNLRKGESLQKDVRTLLGEPEKITHEDELEIWWYRFIKSRQNPSVETINVLNVSIKFKEKKVIDYQVSVSRETVSRERKQLPETVGGRSQPGPIGQPQDAPGRPKRRHGDFITDFDRNADGRVSQEEFAGPVDIFQRFDANTDGFIDSHEAPKGRAPSQPMGQAGQRAGHGMNPHGDFMAEFDIDADGRVSREEFSGPDPVFQRLDINQDGFIDATEAPNN